MFFETILPSYFIPTDFNNFEHLKLLQGLDFNISYDNSSKLSLHTGNPQFSKTLSSVFNRSSDGESYTSNVSNPSPLCHQQDDLPSPTLLSSSTQTDCFNQQDGLPPASLVCSSTQTDSSNDQDCLPSHSLVCSSTQTWELPYSSDEYKDEALQCPEVTEAFQQLKKAMQIQDKRLDTMTQQLASLTGILQQATELILQHSQSNVHVPPDHIVVDNTGHPEHHMEQTQCIDRKTEQSPYQPASRSSLSGIELQSFSQVMTKFDGDSGKFQSFRYRFNTIVDSMRLSDIDKALLLFVSLEDSVLDLIGDIKSDGYMDYHKLWLALEEEYAPLHHGLYSHIAELFTIKYMPQCDSSRKLKDLHSFVKKHFIGLKKIGMCNEVEGFKLQILSKLCGTASEKVCELMSEADGQQVVPQILEIIQDEVRVLELQELADSLNENIVPEDKSGPNEKLSQSGYIDTSPPKECIKHQRLQYQQFSCIFCNRNDHISSMCRYYSDTYYYQQILFQKFLCYNCFDYGHKSYACPHSKQCNLCKDNRKHSPVLCTRNSC